MPDINTISTASTQASTQKTVDMTTSTARPIESVANMDQTDWMTLMMEMRIMSA